MFSKLAFFLFLLFSTNKSLNISNINNLYKKKILSSMSKVAMLYTTQYTGEINSTEPIKPKKHHTLDNHIYFYSPVTEESSLYLEKQLVNLNERHQLLLENHNIDNGPIHLHIQSFGGSLFHTIYLMDLIQNSKTPIYTYVDGFAASAATLLSVAGKKRFMTKNSLMLIHQLSGGSQGKYSEMKDENENLDVLMDIIINFYLNNSKFKKDELLSILNRDIWLNSQRCLQYGLIDEIL